MSERLRFDRHELAGAFGDIGTDLPLLIGLVTISHLDAAGTFAIYGIMQILTGLFYGLPMPVQPLKAMAAIMLSRHLSAGTLTGGGLVVGGVMLLLSLSGLLTVVAKLVPRAVVRGIQAGLAITLGKLALVTYCRADGTRGIWLAVVALCVYLLARRQTKVPAPLFVIALGIVYALVYATPLAHAAAAFGLHLPTPHLPDLEELKNGALILAVPQLALSLGNSVIATSTATKDLFPDRALSVKKIGITYGLMNLIGPPLGGVPTCHGCGGFVGFYNFGARTGGAPVIYGSIFVVLGLLFAPGLAEVVRLFPMPMLGVVLLLEAIALLRLTRDATKAWRELVVMLAVVAAVLFAPGGYAVALVGGVLLSYALAYLFDREPRRSPA
ncbi:MAG: putative sulfate/molybdate transporter [Polyangia bacterium]